MNASGAIGHGWLQMNSTNLYGDGGVCVRVRVCSRMHMHVRVGLHACMIMRFQYTIIIFDLG